MEFMFIDYRCRPVLETVVELHSRKEVFEIINTEFMRDENVVFYYVEKGVNAKMVIKVYGEGRDLLYSFKQK